MRRGHICYLIAGALIIVILMKIFSSQNEPKRKIEANHIMNTTVNGKGEKEKQLIEDQGINELLEKAKGATTLDIIQGGQSEENPGVVDPPTTITNPQQIQLLVQQLHRRETALMTEGDWVESYLLRFYDKGNIMGDLMLKESVWEKTFWVEYKGKQYDVDRDFFRMIKDLKRYKPNEELMPEDAIALFSKYISIEEIKHEAYPDENITVYGVIFFIRGEVGGEENYEPVYIGEENGVRVIYSQGI